MGEKNREVKDVARKTSGTVFRKPIFTGVSKIYPVEKLRFSRGLNKNHYVIERIRI